jgi:hypothetical protein
MNDVLGIIFERGPIINILINKKIETILLTKLSIDKFKIYAHLFNKSLGILKIMHAKNDNRINSLSLLEIAISEQNEKLLNYILDKKPTIISRPDLQRSIDLSGMFGSIRIFLKIVKLVKDNQNLNVLQNSLELGVAVANAAYSNHLKFLKFLKYVQIVDIFKLDLNALDGRALISACLNGNLEILKLLIDFSQQPKTSICLNILDNQPIRLAFEAGHVEIVKYLLSLPFSYGIKLWNYYNNRELIVAASSNHLNMVKYIISMYEAFHLPYKHINEAIERAKMLNYREVYNYLSITRHLYNVELNRQFRAFQQRNLLPSLVYEKQLDNQANIDEKISEKGEYEKKK